MFCTTVTVTVTLTGGTCNHLKDLCVLCGISATDRNRSWGDGTFRHAPERSKFNNQFEDLFDIPIAVSGNLPGDIALAHVQLAESKASSSILPAPLAWFAKRLRLDTDRL
jgi:hypothetical protein